MAKKETRGMLKRISGPVVEVKDLEDAKLYDVVRVGEEGLVGEIIKIIGNTCVVQVYEETSGIRPGEPVENTGMPLSVELGPGILKNIYDGIQRPLRDIELKSGHFIKRGIFVPSLPRDKKWEFDAKVKNGERVKVGDILGTVQETELIEHRILSPYEGKIEKIKSGKYTIEDEIGELTVEGKKKNIYLMQKWPVRTPRPYVEKLPPIIPLITGQRVIDTFFPIAKGGTACIPGPFGSGKCVSGDTPVLLADGSLITMKELYEKCSGDNVSEINFEEEIIALKKPILVYSLNDSKIMKSTSTIFYKGKSDSLIKIKTKEGRFVEVTPIHKLFKINEKGEIVETMAKNLNKGDFILSIRKIETNYEDKEIDVELLRRNRKGCLVKIPEKVTKELSEFLGLFIAKGYIRADKTLVFTDSDNILLQKFLYLAKQLFGIEGKIEHRKNKTSNALLTSEILVDFIKLLNLGENSTTKRIPTLLLQSSDKTIALFLKGYFLGNGSFHNGKIELSTTSKQLSMQLSYTLTRFGILHSISHNVNYFNKKYRIFIKDINNLQVFYNVIKDEKEKIADINAYIESKQTERACTPTYTSFDNFVVQKNYNQNCSQLLLAYCTKLAEMLDWVFCDQIIEKEESIGSFDVYDISVPGIENFVGGYGGLLLHNTVTQQSLAKYSDTEIVVYIGCGERGNEMTEVLTEFPHLEDEKTKKPLMERTVLIANTSNMPVAAREASIYTGITLAEYYRDMGYNIALMADSTSRWAEALREIGGRLEEMPGEEGYPAYLARRLAEFYERAGKVRTLGSENSGKGQNGGEKRLERFGSISIIGAVSPPGGDISEPVSQNTLRVTKVFLALDAQLAQRRHFPAINWLKSYSLYKESLDEWLRSNVSEEFPVMRDKAMELLQKEAELQEIVQLVGPDALPDKEQVVLLVAKMLREDFLQQNAYSDIDAKASFIKQYLMLKSIMLFHEKAIHAVDIGIQLKRIQDVPVKAKIGRMKEITEKEQNKFVDLHKEINADFAEISKNK